MKRLLPILLCLLLLCACGRSEAAPVGTWVNAGQYTEGRDFVETVTLRDDGSLSVHLDYRGEPYALPLLGRHQLKNAATVLELVEVLRKKGWKLEQGDVEHGLYAVSWPGRFELLSDEP